MGGKRLFAFILIVVLLLGAIGATSDYLVKNVKLGLDLKGGFEILYVASPIEEGGKVTLDSLRETANSLKRRVDPDGTLEPEINPEGTNRIRAKIAIASNADEKTVRELMKKPSYLSFKDPDGNIMMDGRDFVPDGAKVEYKDALPIVAIKLKSQDKFKEVTTKLVGKPMGIYLDDQMISNPKVNSVINSDSAIIEGGFSYEEAQNLANTINLGALPLKLEEKYTQSVGATLGLKSLEETVKAGLIALIIVLIGMMVFYRVPGIIASVTLVAYTWLLLLVLVLLHATLTLPGIAAFVLGIGMAVDANIITYERIKEEIRSGKSIMSSLRAGSKNSFRTIIDANVTTILAGTVLYFIGTGSIQGFALTLIFSILVSVITNVFLSRLLLHLLVRGEIVKKPAYFGVKEAEIHAL